MKHNTKIKNQIKRHEKKKNVVLVKRMAVIQRERMDKIKKEYEELVLYIYGTLIPPGAYTFDEFYDNYGEPVVQYDKYGKRIN